jgi:hypothetical protein
VFHFEEGIVRTARFITACVAALVAVAIVPALAGATPGSFIDDDFAGGAPDANTAVIPPGLVALKPVVSLSEGFGAGPGLPGGWTASAWNPGGTATVGAGALRVDGALAAAPGTYNAGQSLSFRAQFTGDPNEHIGFASNLNDAPWAIFSTGGSSLPTGLYARTFVGTAHVDVPIGGVDLSVPHNFEIDWSPSAVNFYVDGTLVSAQPVSVPNGLRVLASDFDTGGGALLVDALTLVPSPPAYPSSGVFASRVFDGTPQLAAWGGMRADGLTAGVILQTRSTSGSGAWSDWQGLGAGGAIASPAQRYLQYRMILLSNGTATPVVDRVTIGFDVDTAAPSASIASVAVTRRTAVVSFSSPDADVVRFECRLDSGAFATCGSPKSYSGLRSGTHNVSVRAIDRVGNVGPATTRSFAFDATAPKVVPSPRTVRSSSKGRVALRVACPKTEQACRIAVQLRRGHKAASSKRTVTPAGGKRAKVTLRLRKSVRTYLARHARLKLTAVTVAHDAAGNRRTTRARVTVRAPRR